MEPDPKMMGIGIWMANIWGSEAAILAKGNRIFFFVAQPVRPYPPPPHPRA